jgi:hypothetical protein
VVNPCLSGGALEIFLVPQVPAPLVRICGATPIADALIDICGTLGYSVAGDDSGVDMTASTAVVIASHGGPEAETIRAALDAGVGYIGLVASRIRGGAVLADLKLTDAERARVHTPLACRSELRPCRDRGVDRRGGDRGHSRRGPFGVGSRPAPARTVHRPGMRHAGRRRPDGPTSSDRRRGSLVLQRGVPGIVRRGESGA